jgi:signal transduction histidine kinase
MDVTDITIDDLMERLAHHRMLGPAPANEHAWIASRGTLRRYEVGSVVTAKGTPAKNLLVVFDGRLVIRADRGAGSHKIFEWKDGDVGGVMPYSRGASPPHDVVAEEPTELLAVPREVLTDMIYACPVITAALVHAMVDRAREFKSSDLRDEKLISLGKLAAGLAHELNNPASAVLRSAKMLGESLTGAEQAARALAAAHISPEQFASIDAARVICSAPRTQASLSTVARADREDAITDWLADHGASEDSALALADSGVEVTALDKLATELPGDALDAALRWIAACCTVRALSSEIETAASRIHDLVSAVKGFSYMDHAPTAEPVDIRRGITDTLTVLGNKTRGKSASISLELPDDLPRAHAVGAELNQVWMNLLDNALDAIPSGGHVSVTAQHELDSVVVRIIDDGPGIPKEIQGKIFDPFFTTKGVGSGTGLGLDIVRRLLQRYEGDISVESVPGRTEFQVRLRVEK